MAITYFTDDDVPYLRPIAQMVHQVHIQQAAFATAAATNMDDETRAAISAPTNPIPEWMLKLPRSRNQKDRKRLRTSTVDREGVTKVAGGLIGKRDAVKKRQIIKASRRRKEAGVLGGRPGKKLTKEASGGA